MTDKDVSEPKGILEVRQWKEKVSARIREIGFAAFSAEAAGAAAVIRAELDALRKGRLSSRSTGQP